MRVSLIIATHNRPALLRRALESVAIQTFSDMETIVIDDNGVGTSQQRQTSGVVEEFPWANYIANQTNAGKAASMNLAVKLAGGSILAFLDDDDEFHPDKISFQVARLESTQAAGVYCNYERIFRG